MLKILFGLVLGFGTSAIIVASMINSSHRPLELKVGDCVRKLGFNATEKITLISPYGGIETEWKSLVSDGKIISAYENKILLVKVNCENQEKK